MTKPTTTEPTTQILEVPGARLAYDVRPAENGTDAPPLLLIALPMEARGFTSLAARFPDRTVVTYDPRGVGRSERTDGAAESNPTEHADDVHRLIAALGNGPVDLFGSSGGAVVGLELVARHPEQVRTLVAHEPPSPLVLPDRQQALAAVLDIRDTYRREGFGAGMAKFIAVTSIKGPFPDDVSAVPSPDPAAFGLPAEDDGRRDDALLAQNIIGTTHHELDFDALKAVPTRIVVAAGAESEGEFAHRAALAVAERLGTEAVIFPSHHGGFLGDEFGMPGDPDGFAAKLRDVL